MNKKYSMWLHKLSLSEYIKIKMLQHFGSYQKVYYAKKDQYQALGLTEKQIVKIEKSKEILEQFTKIIHAYEDQQIHIVDLLDPLYPFYLKQIADPPIVLFVKGDIEQLNKPIIAIVGSRKCTEYGFDITYKFSSQLAQMGIRIISGMASGIDEAAHKGALSTGHTLAVLGTGIDICYPSQNKAIYESIPKQGCLISEYFLGTTPMGFQFPKRNRIISGMALGVLVVEADLRSGSLITANLALEHNRDVFAVPGNINSRLSLGTNELIKNGAKCVTQIEDILTELPSHITCQFETLNKDSFKNSDCELAQDESIVYAYVSQSPMNLNELFHNTQLPYEIVYPSLIKLEIKGLIKRLPGERYIRI